MNALQIAPDIRVEIFEIGHQMNQAGLPKEFVADAGITALELEGAYDLLKLWAAEKDAAERDEIVADIQELIDDLAQTGKVETKKVHLNDLEAIAKDVQGFKDHLRAVVDERGGVKRLAELTGIPQPSLSRFFNTPALPRRTTLLKIARALKLNEVEVPEGWER